MRAIPTLVLVLVMGACGDSSTTVVETTAAVESPSGSSATTVAVATSAASSGDSGEVRDDIPPACELATAAEVSALVGVEVTAGETIGGECSYDAADEFSLFLTAGAFPLPADECAVWLPSEPLFDEETVEPAPEFGDHATIITAELRTDFFVCASGAAASVEMIGPETMTAEEQKGVAAGVMELILGSL